MIARPLFVSYWITKNNNYISEGAHDSHSLLRQLSELSVNLSPTRDELQKYRTIVESDVCTFWPNKSIQSLSELIQSVFLKFKVELI